MTKSESHSRLRLPGSSATSPSPLNTPVWHCRLAAVVFCLLALRCSKPVARPSIEAVRHNNLGVALMDAGVKDPRYFMEAIKEFETALQISPAYRIARINLGMGQYYAGQAEQSLSTLESVAKEAPDSLPIHFMLGLLKEMKGQFADARQHFSLVTRQDPQDPDAWYHLGYCFSKERDYLNAIAPFEKAATLVPYQRRMRYNLFMALNRAGKTAEAQAELDRFRQLENSTVRVVEAPKSLMEYLKQGKYAEAIPETSTGAPSPDRAPSYSDVAQELGLNFQHHGTSQDADIREVLQGKPQPGGWFLTPANRTRLMEALGSGAAFCDYNNDGRLDVFLVDAGRGGALYEQGDDGRFQDISRKAGLINLLRPGMACAWADYDNDGWADLLVTYYGAIQLYRNRQGRFEDVTVSSGLARFVQETVAYMGAAFVDVDHDGDTDIYVACLLDLNKASPGETIRFPADFEGQPNLLFRNNSQGRFSEIAREARADGGNHQTRNVWFADVDEDRAVDFLLLDAGNTPTILLNRKDGSFLKAAQAQAKGPMRLPLGESRAYGDFNNDGAVDELLLRNGATVILNRNESKPARWLAVRLEGYAVPGKVKSNRMGIGAKVEVRSVGQWERQELRAGNGMMGSDAPLLYFDLSGEAQPDFVRAIFPSGVRWTLKEVHSNQTVHLSEPLLDVNSCPTIFAWNGRQFEFITDTLSAGILGELVAPQQYWQPDPDEWLRITDRQLKPTSNHTLELRFTNSLEEVTYLDQVKLLAVDHPASVEVYADERITSQPLKGAQARFYAVKNPRPVSRIVDQHGHDAGQELARTDRVYFDRFKMLPFKGFAEDWSLTLDLGQIRTDAAPVLLLQGWSYWNSSAAIVAASQARQALWGPVLEVQGEGGRWRTALADMGVIAGLPRTMLLDLSRVLKGSRKVRIRANRTLYYDRIWLADGFQVLPGDSGSPGTPSANITATSLQSAELRWLGYPRRILPDGRLPEIFDYADILQQAEWGTHAGLLTRYGDVRPLLQAQDDQLVVMGHGEEIALSFDARPLLALGAGWKRTYFLHSNGFTKGYELHSGASETVGPLPFQSMTSYPPHREKDHEDEQRIRYLLEWNTRPSFWRR